MSRSTVLDLLINRRTGSRKRIQPIHCVPYAVPVCPELNVRQFEYHPSEGVLVAGAISMSTVS